MSERMLAATYLDVYRFLRERAHRGDHSAAKLLVAFVQPALPAPPLYIVRSWLTGVAAERRAAGSTVDPLRAEALLAQVRVAEQQALGSLEVVWAGVVEGVRRGASA